MPANFFELLILFFFCFFRKRRAVSSGNSSSRGDAGVKDSAAKDSEVEVSDSGGFGASLFEESSGLVGSFGTVDAAASFRASRRRARRVFFLFLSSFFFLLSLPQLARVVVLRQLSGGAEKGEGTLSSGLWGDAGGFGVAGSRGDAGPAVIKLIVVERRKEAPQGSRVSRPVVVERRAQGEEEGAVHRCSLYWRCVLLSFDVRVKGVASEV